MPIPMDPPEISWENTLGSPNGVPFDGETKELVGDCMGVPIPPPVNILTVIKKSDGFPVPFPIKTVQSSALRARGISEDILEVISCFLSIILCHFVNIVPLNIQ